MNHVTTTEPDQFIREIKKAPKWLLTEDSGYFMLTVIEKEEEKKFFGPDPLSMSDTEYRVFLNNILAVTEIPGVSKNGIFYVRNPSPPSA